jgi:hypothetical protein
MEAVHGRNGENGLGDFPKSFGKGRNPTVKALSANDFSFAMLLV